MIDLAIFLVLIIFMMLFLGGGVLVVKGILNRRRNHWIMGIVLLAICAIFAIAMKYVPGIPY